MTVLRIQHEKQRSDQLIHEYALKLFRGAQVSPAAPGKAREFYLSDPDPFQPCDCQADYVAHPPDLPFTAFDQDDLEQSWFGFVYFCRFEHSTVQFEAVSESTEFSLIYSPFYTDEIFFFDAGIRADELSCNASILGENQQALARSGPR